MLKEAIIALSMLIGVIYYLIKDPHFDIIENADGKWLILWYNKEDEEKQSVEREYTAILKLK